MTTTIQFDHSGESQVFTATRAVRNSDHAHGTIHEGETVFFRQDGEGVTLAYAESGEPTNGNQYAVFPTPAEAEAFVARAGLAARD
jgi:hypothetical protein